MNYKKTTLKNGLRLITVPIPNSESATVTIWANVGSRYENAKNSGISHFLEHMVFKGSKKRPTAKEISEAIDEFGGEFNASTSKDWTNFYIKARTAKLELAFDVLADMVLYPILRQDDIDREKGVIIEEIGMYEDTPMMHVDDLFENLIFEGTELGRDIIGTRKTVASLKQSDFVSYRSIHYGSNNILVTIAGGVDVDNAEEMTEKFMGKLALVDATKISNAVSNQTKPRILLSSQKKEQAHFVMGFRGNARGHKDRFVETVLSTILGGGMSSRLFTEVREKRGLAYSVNAGVTQYDDTGYQEMYAGVDVKRAEEAVKVSLDQYYGISTGEYKISSKELIKAKEYLKGHLALSLEDTKSVNKFFGLKELKLGIIETPEDIYKGIDEVAVDDLLRVAKELFVPSGLNLAIIGPYKDESKFVDILNNQY